MVKPLIIPTSSLLESNRKARPSQLLLMYRSRTGLTQSQLAAKLGFKSLRMIQYWEADQSLPKADNLKKLIEVFIALGTFIAGKELEEARQLWASVKGAFDTTQERDIVYPILDTEWLKNLVQTPPLRLITGFQPAPGDSKQNLTLSSNLPAPTKVLFGRENDIAQIKHLLTKTRLLSITGPGGTGKTQICLQIAPQVAGEFPDGVYFVGLATITDRQMVVSAILQTLGIKEAAGQSLLESLKTYLLDKHLMLLLDNFEQVLAAAPIVTELLEAAPMLKIMVTSRVVLRLAAEQEYSLPPLVLPDLKKLPSLEKLADNPAVGTFVERARQVKPDFQLSPDNAGAIAEICIRLDGLPLALELAAVRVRLFNPQAILRRLTNRLSLLTGGLSDVPQRHQTLRATMDWSYGLLEEPEQRLFRYLGIFMGGCNLAAIEHIAPEGFDILNLLSGLEEKSLIRHTNDSKGEPRFYMLETIHEYALEQLTVYDELAASRLKHASYFLELAEQAEPKFRGSAQAEWLDILEIEHDNLRASMRWLLAQKSGLLALRLGAALWPFWWTRCYLSEGRGWLEAALALGDFQENLLEILPVRAKVLNGAGLMARDLADYEKASYYLEQSLALEIQLGNQEGQARVLNNLGAAAFAQSNYNQARSLFEKSLTLWRELNNSKGIAGVLNNTGNVFRDLGDPDSAAKLYKEGLALYRKEGDEWGVALSLNNLGLAHLDQKNYEQSRLLCQASLILWEILGDKEGIATCLEGLVSVLVGQNRFKRAAVLCGIADNLRAIIGVPALPGDQLRYQKDVSAARTQLGPAEYEAAHQRDCSLEFSQVVNFVLENDS